MNTIEKPHKLYIKVGIVMLICHNAYIVNLFLVTVYVLLYVLVLIIRTISVIQYFIVIDLETLHDASNNEDEKVNECNKYNHI